MPPRLARIPPALLGLAVAVQLAFMPLDGLLEMAEHPAAARLKGGVDLWGQATGNGQSWGMFSNGRLPVSVFLAVEAYPVGGGPPETILSRFESEAWRVPMAGSRAFHHEMMLSLEYSFLTDESLAAHPDEWRAIWQKAVAEKGGAWAAHLRGEWAAHGDGAFAELRLVARQTAIQPDHAPPRFDARPVARLLADGSLEVFDPLARRFQPAGVP